MSRGQDMLENHEPGVTGWLKNTAKWLGSALLTPFLTTIMVTVFGIWAAPIIADRLKQPTCDDPGDLIQETKMTATGAAKPADNFPHKGRVTYDAKNLIDGNSSTAWVEDEDGLGIGAEVGLTFAPVDVRLVCMVNGYGESWSLYQRNSRVRLLETQTDQGIRTSLLRDDASSDHPATYQTINFAAGETSEIKFTIKGAYAAQRSSTSVQSFADTSISEIEVWASP